MNRLPTYAPLQALTFVFLFVSSTIFCQDVDDVDTAELSGPCSKANYFLEKATPTTSPRMVLMFCDSARPYAKRCDNDEIQWQLAFKSMSAYRLTNNLIRAQKIGLKAMHTFRGSHPLKRAVLANQLSLCYVDSLEFENKAKYMKIAVDLSREHQLPELPIYLCNYAEILLRMGEGEEALRYLKEGEALDHMINTPQRGLFIGREVLFARVYDALDKKEEYDKSIEKCKAFVDVSDDSFYKMVFWSYYSQSLLRKNDFEQIPALADSLFRHSKLLSVSSGEIVGHYILGEYYKSKNRYDLAITHLERSGDLKDSMNVLNNSNLEQMMGENIELLTHEFKLTEEKYKAEMDARRQKHDRVQIIYISLIVILGVVLFAVFLYARHYRLKQKKKELEEKQDSMNLELQKKNGELASKIVQMMNTSTFLSDLVNDLEKDNKDRTGDQKNYISKIVRKIKRHSETKVWNEFDLRFQQLHKDFYTNLLNEFPNLTYNEKRLCSFIKLDMNVKDISNVTGQSPHSIRVARVRLRKKFNLTNTTIKLEQFIEKF